MLFVRYLCNEFIIFKGGNKKEFKFSSLHAVKVIDIIYIIEICWHSQ